MNPIRLLICIWSIHSAIYPSLSFGQTSATITGIVLAEDSKEPLPNAIVRVKNSSLGAITNTDGYFTILKVPKGKLVLEISYLGYLTKEVPLPPDISNLRLTIEMESSTFQVEEVIIATGTQQVMKTDGISQISVNPAELVSLPGMGETDIFRSLQLMPGISGSNESTSGLFIRGGTPDQNLILFDGFTVYHVDHFFGFFSAFNANALKDVQLYKGGFEAKYGGRLSSVVELTGKRGNIEKFDFNLGLSNLSTKLGIEIPLWKRGSLQLSGRRSFKIPSNNPLSDRLGGKIFDLLFGQTENPNLQTQPAFHFYDLNAKLTWLPSDKDVISISFYHGQDDLDNSRMIDLERSRGDQFRLNLHNEIEDKLQWGNLGTGLTWSRQWNPKWYTHSTIGYSNYFSFRDTESNGSSTITRARNNASDTTINRTLLASSIEDNEVRDITLRINTDFQASYKHKLSFGTQITGNHINYLFQENDTLEILNRDEQGSVYSFYIQDKWSPAKGLLFTAGFRGSYFNLTSTFYPEPRVSLSYKLTDKLKLKAAYGRFHQFTNRIVREDVTQGSRDFWLLANGDNIPVGFSQHLIAGAAYESGDFLLDVEAYQKDLDGLSEFSLRFSRNRTAGIGRGLETEANELFFTGSGIARGIEFLLHKKFGKYTGWISYTLSEVVHDFPEISSNAFYALHHQLHELKLVNSLKFRDWTLAGTWVYASGKPYSIPGGIYQLETIDGRQLTFINVGGKNSAQLPPYHRLDLSASLVFKIKQSDLSAGIAFINVYNRKNIWYKTFDVQENELIVNDITYLGLISNFFINFNLR